MNDKRPFEVLLTTTNKTVFTTQDLQKIWRYSNYRSLITRINYYAKTDKLTKLKLGLYSITGIKINEFELANKLRTPSYVSFETVLHREGIIFQWDSRITLAGKESKTFNINNTAVVFRQIKDNILFNKMGVVPEETYFIATKERAILDTLYTSPNFFFDNLRTVNFDKLLEMANLIYKVKALEKTVKKLSKLHSKTKEPG
jgi:hypothetical protein